MTSISVLIGSERGTSSTCPECGRRHKPKGSKYELAAKQQNWKCPNCGRYLINGEDIETHHIVPVKDGGSDDIENLIHLHSACHEQEHSKTKFKA